MERVTPILRVSRRSAEGRLHDERGGVAAYEPAQDHQNARLVSSEESAIKLLYLTLIKVVAKWETVQHWKQMLNYLDTVCGDDPGGRRPTVKQITHSSPAG